MHETLDAYYDRLLTYRRTMFQLATHPALKADWAREIRALEALRAKAAPAPLPLAA